MIRTLPVLWQFVFLSQAIDVFMFGCTVFVFLSLIEYALVNLVMVDIAAKKNKSQDSDNLILETFGRQLPKRDGEFPCDAVGNVSTIYTLSYFYVDQTAA